MADIARAEVIAIYQLFDKLHSAVIRVAVVNPLLTEEGKAAINEADSLADDMETIFSRILTPEERGDDGT